jgi:hypothetical protein
MFLSHILAYKVAIGYTPYQLVYGLHIFMPTKHVLLAFSADHKDTNPIKIHTKKLSKLEKLQNDRLLMKDTSRSQQ